MYWPPDLEHRFVKQQLQELVAQASRERLTSGVRPLPVRAWLKPTGAGLGRIVARLTVARPREAAAPSIGQRRS